MKRKREQIKVLKAAFFTEIGFTTSEAEKFWPVYNTYDDKQFELRHQKNEILCKTNERWFSLIKLMRKKPNFLASN
jgi:hypothetical protein